MYKFGSLFHDGEVCRKVGVENRIGTEHPQSGVNLAGHQGSGLKAEGFADGDTDRRGHLNHHVFGFVTDCGENVFSLVLLIDGTDRTVGRTLAALDAWAFVQQCAAGRLNDSFITPVNEFQGPDALHLLAHLNTATTVDALPGIQNYGRR